MDAHARSYIKQQKVLLPLQSKSKGYIVCKECRQDFADSFDGMKDYVHHFKIMHGRVKMRSE